MTETISNLDFESLEWHQLKGTHEELTAALRGCRIVDADGVDFPLTDELELFLEDNSGQRYALRAGIDPADPEARFYIDMARVPAQTTPG